MFRQKFFMEKHKNDIPQFVEYDENILRDLKLMTNQRLRVKPAMTHHGIAVSHRSILCNDVFAIMRIACHSWLVPESTPLTASTILSNTEKGNILRLNTELVALYA
jgi:hypothetical protein